MKAVREIKQRSVRFRGQEHSGWLPAHAAQPLTSSERVELIDFAIFQEDASSFILEWTGPDNETSGDTWHPDLDAALQQAHESFGVEPSEWRIANGR